MGQASGHIISRKLRARLDFPQAAQPGRKPLLLVSSLPFPPLRDPDEDVMRKHDARG
jgi:hypothetical protein